MPLFVAIVLRVVIIVWHGHSLGDKSFSGVTDHGAAWVAAGMVPRRVRELDDPIALGVHPAAMVARADGERSGADRVPPYITRDIDGQLRAAVARGGFVLLIGDSTAGKTRAAYEAVRALLPDHMLFAPAARDSMATILPAVGERQVLVLATMRTAWWAGAELGAGLRWGYAFDRAAHHRRS